MFQRLMTYVHCVRSWILFFIVKDERKVFDQINVYAKVLLTCMICAKTISYTLSRYLEDSCWSNSCRTLSSSWMFPEWNTQYVCIYMYMSMRMTLVDTKVFLIDYMFTDIGL